MTPWNVRHYRLVARSGVFQGWEYGEAYLRGSRWKPYPLLHYLLFGEERGHRPNALFDPAFVRDRHDCGGLGDYLGDRRFWPCATSDLFDGTYYAASVSPDDLRHISPLENFWSHGFDRDLDPAETFETRFFKQATSRDDTNKKGLLYRLVTTSSQAPFSMRDLTRRQQAFLTRIEPRLLFDATGPARRRNLVWIQCGAAYDNPYRHADRSFDVMLNYYEKPNLADHPSADERPAEIAVYQQGTKCTGLFKVVDGWPHLVEAYDYVLLLDDDVDMSAKDIEGLFQTMATERLDLAQPSLSPDSETWFRDLKQPTVGPATRPVTAVEIMAPCLSRDALRRCAWTFSKSISGWAADLLLSAMVKRELGSQPCVVGACEAKHLRPLDTEEGNFYRFLISQGIDANIEAGAIGLAYDVDVDKRTAIRLL